MRSKPVDKEAIFINTFFNDILKSLFYIAKMNQENQLKVEL